jgi:hypothetical protein
MTVLLVLTGESYRLGPQMSRGRGGEEGKKRQILASLSHMKLVNALKEKNIESDICMITYAYTPEYDNELTSIYSPYLKYSIFFPALFPTEEHFIDATTIFINNIDITGYSHIIFIRIDVFLKDYFIRTFELNVENVIFAHVDTNTRYENYKGVCHFLCIFPKKYFEYIKYRHPHTAASDLVIHIGYHNIGLIINTLHLISTDLEWNPLYIQVGRHNSLDFYAKDKIYNTVSREIEYSNTLPFNYEELKEENILENMITMSNF